MKDRAREYPDVFIYVDPPYYKVGRLLYNAYFHLTISYHRIPSPLLNFTTFTYFTTFIKITTTKQIR